MMIDFVEWEWGRDTLEIAEQTPLPGALVPQGHRRNDCWEQPGSSRCFLSQLSSLCIITQPQLHHKCAV